VSVTLGNRAYEAINKVLDLFGDRTVNDIDIEQAFPVHDLNNVVQAARAYPTIWYALEQVTTGAGTRYTRLDPRQEADWEELTFGGENTSITLGGTLPYPQDWDIVLTHFTVSATDTVVTSTQFAAEDGVNNTGFQPITAIISSFVQFFGPIYVGTNTTSNSMPYYLRPMPYFLPADPAREGSLMVPYARHAVTDNVSLLFSISGWVAPPGVLSRDSSYP